MQIILFPDNADSSETQPAERKMASNVNKHRKIHLSTQFFPDRMICTSLNAGNFSVS